MASSPIKPLQIETLARALPILTIVFGLGYALAAYSFLFIPKLGRMVPGGDLDVAPYQRRVDEAVQYQAKVKAMQQDYAAVDAGRRAKVQAMVPMTSETQSLYILFDTLVTSSGGVLTSVDTVPNTEMVNPDGRYEVVGNVNLRGMDYEQFKRFLAALERTERIIDVSSVSLGSSEGSYSLPFRAYGFAEKRLTEIPIANPNARSATPVE